MPFSPLLQGLAGFTKPAVCCAANLSYAALQLNEDLQFSHSVYGLGSGTPCFVVLSEGHLLRYLQLPNFAILASGSGMYFDCVLMG